MNLNLVWFPPTVTFPALRKSQCHCRWGSYSRTLQFRSRLFWIFRNEDWAMECLLKKKLLYCKSTLSVTVKDFFNIISDINRVSFKLIDTAFVQTKALMITACFANFLAHMQWHQPFWQLTSSQSNQRVLNKQPIKSKSSKSVWNGVAIGILTMEYLHPSALADTFILVRRA